MIANQAERQRWNDETWVGGWPKREKLTDRVTPFLLEALALQPGERVLDVGCGGGRATLAAASAVGAAGHVTGVDISGPLIALARERAADAGVRNVSFLNGDAQVDDIGDGHLDVAMSQFGVMFFDDPVTAFAHIRDQLRVGGRIGFASWQPLDRNPWFPGPALARFVPPSPPPAEGKSPTGPFTLGDPLRVTEILTAAGFIDLSLVDRETIIEAPADAALDESRLRSMGIAADAMDEARAEGERHLSQFGDPRGLCHFPLAFRVVTAHRR